jgi:hypothetical protein
MKPGRRPKSGGEYANSKAVESAMLQLLHGGEEWPRSQEIVAEMTRAGVANARVVWNRGKTRLIVDHGRLEVRAELDTRHRAIERYRLRFVEGQTFMISIQEYRKLPEDLRRFYRPIQPLKPEDPVVRGLGALGDLFAGLSQANLEILDTEKIEKELLRRERANPNELLSDFARRSGDEAEQLARLRPVRDDILEELLKGRAALRRKGSTRRAGPASQLKGPAHAGSRASS